jgi:hypothetical protein
VSIRDSDTVKCGLVGILSLIGEANHRRRPDSLFKTQSIILVARL